MQLKIFSIPAFGSEALEEEMNKFLRTHRILQIERHFCPDNGGYWAVMVEYMLGDPVAEVPPAERREKSVRKTPKVGDKEISPSEKALWYDGEGCTRQSIAWHTAFNLEISSKAEAFSAFLSQRRFSFADFSSTAGRKVVRK